MNPYLEAQLQKYEQQRASIAGLQKRATDENRPLSEDEMRSVNEQGEQLKTISSEIENLKEIEERNAKVADMRANLLTETQGETAGDSGEQSRGARVGTAYTQDRDPGHYRRDGRNSFFADLYRSKNTHDEDARGRLHDHQRALSTGEEGAGVVPPKWLTDEFSTIARQGRVLADAVRQIPLGDDPRPLTLPRQTAGTSDVVEEQDEENDSVNGDDAWESDTDTVTPRPIAGKQTVSRQMIDMSNPAIDELIYGDLVAVYNSKIERLVGKKILGAGSSLSTTASDFDDMDSSDNGFDKTVEAAIEVLDKRKSPADIVAMTVSRWGKFKKLKDGNGRPLIPAATAGPRNVLGVGTIDAAGDIEGLAVMPTDGMKDSSSDQDTYAVFRASDVLLFESDMLRFRFEEQKGPESIVLGIWGYSAAMVRQADDAVRRVQVDTDGS